MISLCGAALLHIEESLEQHQRAELADLSVRLLETVRGEVEQMREALDPSLFQPGYARFVLDWPDQHGLVTELMKLAYRYGRLKENVQTETSLL